MNWSREIAGVRKTLCVCERDQKKEATVGCEHCFGFVFLPVLMSLGHEGKDKELFVFSDQHQVGKCGYLLRRR